MSLSAVCVPTHLVTTARKPIASRDTRPSCARTGWNGFFATPSVGALCPERRLGGSTGLLTPRSASRRDEPTAGRAQPSSGAKASLTHLHLLLATAGSSEEGLNLTCVIASVRSHPPFSILPWASPQHSKEGNKPNRRNCLNTLSPCFSAEKFWLWEPKEETQSAKPPENGGQLLSPSQLCQHHQFGSSWGAECEKKR